MTVATETADEAHEIIGTIEERSGKRMRSTSLVASIERAETLRRPFVNEAQLPHSARLRSLDISCRPDDVDLDLSPMARILVAEDGGSVRTFAGNLNHIAGWWPSSKARRILHFEGVAARALIVLNECKSSTVNMLSEPMTFVVSSAGASFEYTPDFLVERADGVRVVTEAKADERGLREAEYRRKLGIVAEICRRLGWIFEVVLEDEVFENRFHQINCELIASHRFVRVEPVYLSRLSRATAPMTTYGELAELLDPQSPANGRAIMHALHVRRMVEIELVHWLHEMTPVRILGVARTLQHRGARSTSAFPRPAFA